MCLGCVGKRFEKVIMTNIKTLLHRVKYPAGRAMYWVRVRDNPNWGDDVNPWLFKKITGKKPVYCPHADVTRLLMAGSILDEAGSLDISWGSGLLRPERSKSLRLRKAFAVRGQLSADALEQSGIQSPGIFGDPGLLAADFVRYSAEKHYSAAIIPHYVDAKIASKLAFELGIKIINVSLPIEEFVKTVAAAELIYSSSLHGLICAESLGVPCVWIRFSDNLAGGNLKFHDYLSGTDRNWHNIEPLDLRNEKLPSFKNAKKYCWEKFDLVSVKERIKKAFPFFIKKPNKLF